MQGRILFRGRLRVHAAILACLIASGSAGVSAGTHRREAGWTHYANARWGFCVDYPARWKASVLKDGSGVTLYPDTSADPSSGPSVSISALPDLPDVDNANIVLDDSPVLDLDGNFARTLDNLREYGHASDIRVLEKRRLEFQGYDALKTKFVYQTGGDQAAATQWADETFWINKEYVIFTAVLFGQPDQVRRFEPVYQDIVTHRFQLDCPAKR
jgi:hypothetical protein